MRASSVVDVILGEATSRGGVQGRFEDMKAIASVVVNRAKALGVSLEDVVQRTSEFNAYGQPLPAGVNAYRSLAKQAVAEVLERGPVHNATFYATPDYTRNLPKGLKEVTRTQGHVYFTDPQKRAINTRVGTKQADYSKITSEPLRDVADIQANKRADARLGDAWGFQDPTATRGLTTPANTPMPSTMLGDVAGLARAGGLAIPEMAPARTMTGGLLGDVPAPTPSPANIPPSVMARMSPQSMPAIPTPAPRGAPPAPERTNFAGPVGSFRSQIGRMDNPRGTAISRMDAAPMSDRQITASVPDMPRESAMLSRTAPSMNPRSAMSRPEPSMMDRAAGLLSMDAKASTMPGSTSGGLLSPDDRIGQASMYGATGSWGKPQGATGTWDAPAPTPSPTNFAGPMGSPRAAGVPDYAPPTPPTNFAGPMGSPRAAMGPPRELGKPQSPAFSTPMIDTLGHPPMYGLQRAPVSRQAAPVEEFGDALPDLPAPRDMAPAPTIAGPVGQQRTEQAPTRSNISSPTADRNAAQAAAAAALSEVSNRGKSGGMFSGGFSGPSGVMGGAMLGGTVAGLPGAAIGGLLGSKTVRDSIGLGGLGGGSGYGTGQLSAGALSALNAGWGGFGGMTPTQQLAVGLAQQQQAQQEQEAARAGLFGGWGFSGNQASSSAIGGRTTSYRDGRTSMGGEGGFGSGTMSDSARSSAKGGGGLF